MSLPRVNFPGSPDTWLSYKLLFVLHWTDVSQGRVTALGVIEPFYIVEHVCTRMGP